MTRNRRQRRAAERKAGTNTSANTRTSGDTNKTAIVPSPQAPLSSSSPTNLTASCTTSLSELIESASSAPIDMPDPACVAAMSVACSAPIEEIRESLSQAAGVDWANLLPPTLRRTASTTSKSGRTTKVKDDLPPSPFSPESPASPPAPGSGQGLRSAAETSIDTLDDYIPALLANARNGSPAPTKSPPPPPPTAQVAANSPPPPAAAQLVSSKSPSPKSPASPPASATKPDQPDSSTILRTCIPDQPTITALAPTPTPSPAAQLTADGKLATRATLPLALTQARVALLSATHPSTSSSAALHANQGTWDPTTRRFHVPHPRGPVLPRMGQRGLINARILWPEEGMYLIARGDLQVDGEGEEWGVERWYEEVVGRGGGRMREMYLVYVQLKEAGYMVTRAGQGFVHPSAVSQSRAARTSPSSHSTMLTHFWPKHSRFPMAVSLALHLSTLYITFIWTVIVLPIASRTRLRSLVPGPQPDPISECKHEPVWDFDVWKPISVTPAKFKPSDPPRPDFAVSVVGAERVAEGGLPMVDVEQEQLVAVVDQAAVHFYVVDERGRFVIGDV